MHCVVSYGTCERHLPPAANLNAAPRLSYTHVKAVPPVRENAEKTRTTAMKKEGKKAVSHRSTF